MMNKDVYDRIVNEKEFIEGTLDTYFVEELNRTSEIGVSLSELSFKEFERVVTDFAMSVESDGLICNVYRTYFDGELVFESFQWFKGSLKDAIENNFYGNVEILVNKLQGNDSLSDEIAEYLNDEVG